MSAMCFGKVAIVTGASSGIGRSTALTLACEGASVVVNYQDNVDAASQIVAHIADEGGSALAVQASVLEADGCEALVKATIEQLVDILPTNKFGGFLTSNKAARFGGNLLLVFSSNDL